MAEKGGVEEIEWKKNIKRQLILIILLITIPFSLILLPILFGSLISEFDESWIITMTVVIIIIQSLFIYVFWIKIFSPSLPYFVGFSDKRLFLSYDENNQKERKIVNWSDIKKFEIINYVNENNIHQRVYGLILKNGKQFPIGLLSKKIIIEIENRIVN